MYMAKRQKYPMYVAGIIERYDYHILIALTETDDREVRLWHFPRGMLQPNESPEAAIRRIIKENLDFEIEIVVGQPPLFETVNGKQVELRYFFCGVLTGEPSPNAYSDIRWVHRIHLSEYDFDNASQPVATWLLAENH